MKVMLASDTYFDELKEWLESSVGDALTIVDKTTAAKSPADILFLVHSSEATKAGDSPEDVEDRARERARSGAVVVFFSKANEPESIEAFGNGWVCHRSFGKVEEAIKLLDRNSKPLQIKLAFERIEQRHLVVALHILVQCVLAPVEGNARADRQEAWRTERSRWKAVFRGLKIEDFQYALTGDREAWPEEECVQVRELVMWFLGNGPVDFDKARGELEKRL